MEMLAKKTTKPTAIISSLFFFYSFCERKITTTTKKCNKNRKPKESKIIKAENINKYVMTILVSTVFFIDMFIFILRAKMQVFSKTEDRDLLLVVFFW